MAISFRLGLPRRITWLPESIDSWFGLDQVLQGCFKVWKLPISFEYCCIAKPLIWCLLSCSTTVQTPPRPIKGSCEHCEHSLNETFMCQQSANYCPFIPFAQWFLPARGGTAWVAGVRKVGSSSTHLGVRGDPSLTDQFIKRICEGLPWNETAKDTWGNGLFQNFTRCCVITVLYIKIDGPHCENMFHRRVPPVRIHTLKICLFF